MEANADTPPGAAVEVDFYVLETDGEEERLRIACRLAEKGWRRGYRVHLRASDERQLETLDALLWTFRAESFVPHAPLASGAEAAVTLGVRDLPAPPAGRELLLINLADALPAAPRPARLAELVGAAPETLDEGRERYRSYRARGWTLRSHRLR